MNMLLTILEMLAASAIVALYVAFWSCVAIGAIKGLRRFCTRLLKGETALQLRAGENESDTSISLIVYSYAPDCLGLSSAMLWRGPRPRTPTPMETIMRVGYDPRFVPCELRRPQVVDEPSRRRCADRPCS